MHKSRKWLHSDVKWKAAYKFNKPDSRLTNGIIGIMGIEDLSTTSTSSFPVLIL